MNTYWINNQTEELIPTADLTAAQVLTMPYPYIENTALLGIMNNHGSDSIVYIREIQINEKVAATTTALTNFNLYRITSLTGGVSLSAVKHDSNNPDIPSEVGIFKYPIATTTGNYLRRNLTTTGLAATSLLGLKAVRGSKKTGGLNLNHVYNNEDSDIQNIVLREGQGIAITTGLVSPRNFPIELTLHFNIGAYSYCVNEIINVQSATDLFGIINRSGSGVVINITDIEWRILRTNDRRLFTIESAIGMHGGTDIIPEAMDSANPAIDSLVEFKKNPIMVQGFADAKIGRNALKGGDLMPLRRTAMATFGKGVGLASGLLTLGNLSTKVFDVSKTNNIGEYVLREGEGLGIFQRFNYGGWGNYEFNILFNVVDNGGTSPSKEISYVF